MQKRLNEEDKINLELISVLEILKKMSDNHDRFKKIIKKEREKNKNNSKKLNPDMIEIM